MKFVMAALLCFVAVSAMFAACSKTEDVNMEESVAPVVVEYPKTVNGGDQFCTIHALEGDFSHMVAPGDTCVHNYHYGEPCPYGQYCSHYGKCHRHIFWNHFHTDTPNTHMEITPHCGGLASAHPGCGGNHIL